MPMTTRVAAWLLMAAVSLLGAAWPCSAGGPKRVLILAEGPILPYGLVLRDSLVAGLRDNQEPLNIYEEAIDRTRFDSAEYDRQLVALYRSKYLDMAPDLVITITEAALDFAVRHRAELFPRSPLLFGAVDERAVRTHDLGANVTGVFNHYDARTTIEGALKLHPDTRRVVVVGGASRLDRSYLDVVRQDLSDLASPTTVSFIADTPLRDVLNSVGALRDDALVLFLSMQSDGDGVARTSIDVIKEVRRVARVPIYGLSGNLMGRGIVGGVLFDVRTHGADLAQRARQLLSGVKASDLVPMRSPNTLLFDARELSRFGVDEARLPSGARVEHRQVGMWTSHKETILIAGAILLGQFFLIAGLMMQRQQRRRADAALRDVAGRLIAAQEAERSRLARDLHDDVSQQLAGLSIALSGLKRRAGLVERATDLQDDVATLQQRATTLAESVRNLSHDLHPDALHHTGLTASLTGYCHRLSLSQPFEMHCSTRGDFSSIDQETAVCLYRITQEALHNVVKHAHARHVNVRLLRTDDRAELLIVDDGRGFDKESSEHCAGLGLVSMTERARLSGGAVSIVSGLNRGTRIRVQVPLTQHPAASPLAAFPSKSDARV